MDRREAAVGARLRRRFVPLLLASLLILPTLSHGTAGAIDLTGEENEYSLTVNAAGNAFSEAEDLAAANVVLDLYRVAEAAAIPGVDSYGFTLLDAYRDDLSPAMAHMEELDSDAWQAIAQAAARIALYSEDVLPLNEEGIPVGTRITATGAGAAPEPLRAGLYLVIARGSDIEDYVLTVTQETEGEGATAEDEIFTVARSAACEYRYAPQLVALPTKETHNTAGSGDWIYAETVDLKPQPERRMGSIQILKTLKTYASSQYASSVPGMFVFEVKAVLDGKTVYNDVFALTFTGAGSKALTIENKIPVGAEVTVTEVYSGSHYRLDPLGSADTRTITVAADTVEKAEFVNDFDETVTGGYGIVNHFAYDETTEDWTSVQLADSLQQAEENG